MKVIVGSERGRLIRERTKYVNDFTAKKTKYNDQVLKFKAASDNYSSDMEKFIEAFVSKELSAIPGATLSVKRASENYYTSESDYYVVFKYSSERKSDSKYYSGESYHNVSSGNYRGFNWSYEIFIQTKTDSHWNQETRQYDRTHTKVLQQIPRIEANLLQSDDLELMKRTYDLFAKIESIDWQAVLDRINSSVPKESDYVTEDDPGMLDTSKYDTAITDYNIARVLGKDIWIKVEIKREESYDPYSDWSPNPGVDGHGWIKVLSATPKFYTFNWMSGDDTAFPANKFDRALRKEIKMKKIYIHPITPVQYQSTEDMRLDAEPDLRSQEASQP